MSAIPETGSFTLSVVFPSEEHLQVLLSALDVYRSMKAPEDDTIEQVVAAVFVAVQEYEGD